MAQKPARLKTMNRDMAKSAYKARSQGFVGGITHWLLVSLVLSLGFGQLLRFEAFGIPLYFHDILVVLILILQGYTLKGHIPRSLFLFLTGLTLGWSIAVFRSPMNQLVIPLLYSLRLLSYLAIYLITKSHKYSISPVIYLISGVTMLLIGLSQYLFMPDMRWAQYLGFDDHLSRLILPHFDPTFTAVMLSLVILSSPLKHLFLTLSFLLAILLTYSRSVWLSLFITGSIFIKNKYTIFIITCGMLIAIFLLPQKFGEGTNLVRTFSINSRFKTDLIYLQKYRLDLLLGRGMNTLILENTSSKYANHASGPNNSYLYLLLTTGILGLVGWGRFMYTLYKNSTHKPMLMFFFIASLFNNVMFYPFSLLWILLVEAMVPSES